MARPKRNAPARAQRAYHHGDLRRAILDAALAQLKAGELQALTFRELARAAQVAHSALYHHFRDRSDLLAAVAGEGFARLLERLHAAAGGMGGPARLRAVVCAYVRFAREHPAYYRVMFLPEVTRPENIAHVQPRADACFAMLMDCIRAVGGADKTEARALGVWSGLHGLVVLGADAGPLSRMLAAQAEYDFAAGMALTLATAPMPEAWP